LRQDNQYCVNGRSRNATAAVTRTRRPTRTPDPTSTPRPTSVPRAERAGEGSPAASGGRGSTEGLRSEGPRSGAGADTTAGGGTDAPGDDARLSGSLGGTGAPLGAAGPPLAGPVGGTRSPGPPSAPSAPGAPSSAGDRPAAVLAEYAGVRVLGPLQWVGEDGTLAVSGLVHHGGAEPRPMVLTLFVLDARGERLGTAETVLWDLLPGESRAFVQPLPPLPAAPTDISVRIEPLAP
jgi:hypothetical protein